jgi:hypothetical protein
LIQFSKNGEYIYFSTSTYWWTCIYTN